MPSECPVCFPDADGSLLPCGHPLCKACLTNLKIVVVALYERIIKVDALKPEYREWLRVDPDRGYISRVNRCKSLCLTGSAHRLRINCRWSAPGAATLGGQMAAGDGDELLMRSTLRVSKLQTDYLHNLIRCLERRCKVPFFVAP